MGVPTELDELVLGLLDKDPRGRPERASAVAASLRSLAATSRGRLASVGPLRRHADDRTSASVTLEAETRDVTTKPEGVATATVRPEVFTHTTVDPPPEVRELPSLSKVLPSVTIVDPLSDRLTEDALQSWNTTSRLGTMDPVVLSGVTERPLETATLVPAPIGARGEISARPVAASATPPTRGQGLLTAALVMLATVSSVSIAWKVTAPPSRASHVAPAARPPEPTPSPPLASAPWSTPVKSAPSASAMAEPPAPPPSGVGKRAERPRSARRASPPAEPRVEASVQRARPRLPASGL